MKRQRAYLSSRSGLSPRLASLVKEYLPAERAFSKALTTRENIELQCRSHGIPISKRDRNELRRKEREAEKVWNACKVAIIKFRAKTAADLSAKLDLLKLLSLPLNKQFDFDRLLLAVVSDAARIAKASSGV
jgi:hypothetical protein